MIQKTIKGGLLIIYIYIHIFYFFSKTILRAEERQGYILHDNLYCDIHVECKIKSFAVHKKNKYVSTQVITHFS